MEIIVIPNEQTPEIRKVDEPIKEYIETHKEKLDAFFEYAKTRTDAVGLAANQTAIDGDRFAVRAFALRSLALPRDWSLVINPVISEYLGMTDIKAEGCLTWKGQTILAERHRAVKVKYYDMNGQIHVGVFSGFAGQIWQHEINHLNGVEEDVHEYADEPVVHIGRNEKCPCGSGMKYKQCCLKLI